VTANEVTTGTVPLYIDTLGRATALNAVNIVSQVDGQIVEAPFEQGAMLKKGDLMFKIFQPPYIAAVEQAEGAVEQARAQLEIDELALERNRPLVPEKLISEQDFQALEATVEKDRGMLRQAEGELLAAKVNLDYTEIRSPVDGMASIYLIDIGNVVSPLDTLATVLTLNPIYVDFIAPEAKFDEIRKYFDQADGGLPVAVVGGLGTLLLLGQELSLYAMIGMFMLMGIVKKNGIMMIDFAIMRQDEGLSPREAVHEACMERFRPIIMTTAAALLGAVPIAVGWGADAAARKPLGSSIVGGLIISQLITLYVTPALYLYFEWFEKHVTDKIPLFKRGERVKV